MHLRTFLLAFCLLTTAAPVAGQGAPDWQQHVRYEMDVRLLADRHQMEGRQRLTYHNNSPDTLRRVFYHLYFNAFDPGSMMAERNRHLPDPDGRVVPRIFELGPDEIGFHRVLSLTQDGRPVRHHTVDTILEVTLAEPIPPGGQAVFEMTFASQVPLQTRRSGRDSREGIDYSMAQWYPKMAAYDHRGWHADPYIGREFYAPFGTFDVRLTLPAHYVVGATGVLQNPNEIGHGYQTDTTATYSYDPADSLTWHFVAENVHDFAWAADPDYVHDRFTDDRGTTYHLLYQPDVAGTWALLHVWAPQIIQYISDHVGPYAYPQFTVVQGADGGMEYPMLTLVTGRRSPYSLLGVTAHEAAHEWFYGALGFNETDYAWMDEGFANYWSGEAVAHILGQPRANHTGAMMNVLRMQDLGLFERPNTHSDWFRTNAAYGTGSYSSGQMLADMLGYVVSDSLRDVFFRELYRRYTFRHPNPFDVEKVAEDVSGLRLDWLFEQFLDTEHALDYAVGRLRSEREGDGWRASVVLERRDEIAMPLDVRLTLADGTTRWVNVPLTVMQGHKPVPEGWTVAAPWPWTSPRYTLVVDDLPARVVAAEIDPLGRTPERTRLNNSSRFPLDVAFLEAPAPSWRHYSLGVRPLGLYAHDFGVGAGAQARGLYFFGDHRLRAMLTLWPQVLFSGGEEPHADAFAWEGADLSAFDGVDYELSYERDVRALGPSATVAASARKHLGFLENTVAFSRAFGRFFPLAGPERRLTLSLLHQYNPTDRTFRLDEHAFFMGEHMASARLHYRVASGDDRIEAGAEFGVSFRNLLQCRDAVNTPVSCAGEYRQSATHAFVEAVKTAGLGGLTGQAHLLVGLGMENLAFHKRFRLGAPSVEEAWRHDAFRQVSAAMDDPLGKNRFTAFSGPGPVAYLLGGVDANDPVFETIGGTPLGTSVAAGSLTLGTGPLGRQGWLRPLSLEAFTGAGTVWGTSSLDHDRFSLDALVADAGVGLGLDVGALPVLQRWTAQSDVLSGLRLSLKLPVWASDPDIIHAGQDAFAFRWLLGITFE